MKINRHLLLFISIAFLLILAACAGDGEPDPVDEETGGTTETGETGDGDGKTATSEGSSDGQNLIIAVPAELSSLSAHGSNDVPSGNVRTNIYETLINLDEDGNPQPGLATEWEQIDDTTWHFKIREGVTFHDGSELNAHVVKQNFDRLLDPDIGSQGASVISAVDSVDVEDDYTFVVKLKYAFAPIVNHLAHNSTAIMSGEIIKADYEGMAAGGEVDEYIEQNPVGTGPFKLADINDYIPGEQITLTRNDDYWGELPDLETITFRTIPEVEARLAELETGGVHIADAIEPDNVDRVDNMDGVSAYKQNSTSLNFIAFNTQVKPFDDERVRRAITMAIDKTQIIDGIFVGTSIPAVGPIPPGVFGHYPDAKPLEYNIEEAKKLLEEAGYADGFEVTLKTNSDNTQRMHMATYVESALSELNIKVNIEGMEFGAFIEDAAEGQTEMFILGWSTPTMDADYSTHLLFHSDNHGQPGNMTFLDDPEVDEILDAARREADQEVRKQLYAEATEMLIEKAPMIFVNHTEYLLGVRENVEGFRVAANGYYIFEDVSIK